MKQIESVYMFSYIFCLRFGGKEQVQCYKCVFLLCFLINETQKQDNHNEQENSLRIITVSATPACLLGVGWPDLHQSRELKLDCNSNPKSCWVVTPPSA